jgi:hypothetical protein
LTVVDLAASYPEPAEVRRTLRRLRRRHRHGQWADRAGDLYTIALAAVISIGLVVSSVHRVPGGDWRATSIPGASLACLVAAAVLLAGGALTLALRAIGPVYAGPAVQTWLLATPGDRGRWLRRRVAGLAVGAVGVGAVGGLAAIAAGARLPLVGLAPAAWVVVLVAAAVTAALAMTLLVRQAFDAAGAPGAGGQTDGVAAAGRVLLLAGVVASAAAIIADHAGARIAAPSSTAVGVVATLVGIGAVAAATVATVTAFGRAGQLDRASLTAGAALAGSAMAATMSVDPTFLFGFVEVQRLRRIGRVRRRRIRGRGPVSAMLDAEVRRLVRHRTPLLTSAAMVGLPYVCAIVLTPVPVTLVRVLAGYVAANALAAGLRTVSRSAALRRSLGRSDGWLRGVHLVAPAAGALIFVVATGWAGRSFQPVFDVLLAAGLALAVLRSATRPPMVYDTAWLVTPLGVVPVGLITQIIRGPDVAIVLAVLFAFVIR